MLSFKNADKSKDKIYIFESAHETHLIKQLKNIDPELAKKFKRTKFLNNNIKRKKNGL